MFKISLDAGHGKDTPGKRVPDNSMHEWEFNQGVVKHMMEELLNYDVKILRVDDPTGKTDVPLGTRTTNINNWGSDVHISVHANAASDEWSAAHGIETFTYIKPSKTSTALAEKVQKSLIKATGLTDRGVKKADFHMLRKSNMPAILCECGFMSNKDEAKLLKSDDYRKKCALAIIAGLSDQFNLKKKEAPKPAATKPAASAKTYRVQVGAFGQKANAEQLLKDLAKKGVKGFITND